ncbi:hypothetical protein [Prochlorococcus sp. MIT 1307]|uniref:hypothetical protein n=1 Tax=Prochlorococcus sp. MIT 1307 TaxID=3096219 RepID=UPI002A75D743|nr:hypothetical protein [Prochlorococcus sp. MIT 1307]
MRDFDADCKRPPYYEIVDTILMHLQASYFQLFAIGLLVASTLAVAQKVFELYSESQEQRTKEKDQNGNS